MKLANNNDPKTHLSELKAHFQTMIPRRDNLLKIGSMLSDNRFNILIRSSLPELYRSTLQTVIALKCIIKLSAGQLHSIKANDSIAFIIEEAQHWVINDDCTKNTESALAACMEKSLKSKGKKKDKSRSDITCGNCKESGHLQDNFYAKGGGKEGQAPWMKNTSKNTEAVVVAADNKVDALFAFTCTSDHVALADKLNIPKCRLGTCIDSGASRNYCPNHTKFSNYRSVHWKITTADGRSLNTVGMGDLHIKLPNGLNKTKTIFKRLLSKACALSKIPKAKQLPPYQIVMVYT